MDKLSMNQRLLLAVVLSFLFFTAYEYFFPAKQFAPKVSDNNLSVYTKSAPKYDNFVSKDLSTKNNDFYFDNEPISIIKSKNYEVHIDNLGRISKFYLNDKKFLEVDGNRTQLVNDNLMPLEVRFSDDNVNSKAFSTNYIASSKLINLDHEPKTLILKQSIDDINVEKEITFFPDGRYSLKFNINKNLDFFITPGLRSNAAIDPLTIHGVLLALNDDSLKIVEDGDIGKNENFNNVNIASSNDKYYTSLFYDFSKPMNVFLYADNLKNPNIFIKGNASFSLNGYIGPKDYSILKGIDNRLIDVIEYGWFSFIAKPMFVFLKFLHDYIGNWGWAIVLFTLIIRILLFPLTYKGMLSMNKLKELSPKMKELQVKYKGDPQKLNMHMMDLYKKHGANPMGGCLPILLQIPIFFAIYRVLLNAIELKGADWILWIHDLSIKDPYFILPILMGITMFLQQKLTPNTFSDPMQAKIMKYLPLIFTFFFVSFPAGLTLYWFINNLCSVIQQIYVNKLFDKQKR